MPIRKKHNPLRRQEALAKILLKDAVIVYTTGEDSCVLMDRITHKLRPVSRQVYQLLRNLQYQWSIYPVGLGKVDNECYIKGDLLYLHGKAYQEDLIPFLEEKHLEYIEQVPAHHFIGAAWVASPFAHDFTEKEAFDIFHSIGAFNRVRDNETNTVYIKE